ncbi:hypothetical protein KRP22_002770 [Phytophthora ramorum]|nr:hypothetical protein KRP23_682 [Phytophthora ramorum]KAH7503365.1 hypothetical protein KRP22_6417 [Phytophthora ramorum]
MEFDDRSLPFRGLHPSGCTLATTHVMTPPHFTILRAARSCQISSVTMALAMAPYVVTLFCMLLRGLQLVFALVAMITAAKAFPMSTASNDHDYDYRLGSAEATFALLVSYTIIEYSGAFLVLVELFPMMLRPGAMLTRTVDSLLAAFALSSGIVLATSDYVQDCDDYVGLLHCTNLKASYVFVILCVVPLVGSILLTFVASEDSRLAEIECRDRAGSYRMVATPMSSTLAPIDNRGIISA